MSNDQQNKTVYARENAEPDERNSPVPWLLGVVAACLCVWGVSYFLLDQADAQIAAVASYVRASFGNKSPAVTADDVKAERAKLGNRSTPWTGGAELQAARSGPDVTMIEGASAPAQALPMSKPSVTASAASARKPWVTPDADKLPDDAWGKTVRYGRDLIVKTYALIGPEVPDPSHRFSGNNMACQNCHLEAGTKQFGLPFQGVYADFPNYRSRSGTVGTIEDRIQGCMTRSMNGKPLPAGGAEMTAMVAYMKFLSDGRPVGEPTPRRGPGTMPEMSRPADPVHGKNVYAENCAACHGADGLGKRVGQVGDAQGYTFPPLWGDDSFNNGAGMDRLIGAANFIHNNMPNGANWKAPVLPEQDAWDVAAFIQSQPRPQKANLDRDYPVKLEKPVDNGYGPYADGFTQDQHRYGPFAEIRARIKQLLAATEQVKPAATP